MTVWWSSINGHPSLTVGLGVASGLRPWVRPWPGLRLRLGAWPGVGLVRLRARLRVRLGVRLVGLGVRLGVGFVRSGARTNALRAADVALGTLGSSCTVDALAVGVASSGISVLAIAVGIAAVVVSVEESIFAYLLGTTSLTIRPESSFTRSSIALVALALALAGPLGCSIVAKGNCTVMGLLNVSSSIENLVLTTRMLGGGTANQAEQYKRN